MVSYRSIPKILNLFNNQTNIKMDWIPHFTSTINWIGRAGVGMLKEIGKIEKPWIAIIDHSINIGTKKLFVVLKVEIDILYKREKAMERADKIREYRKTTKRHKETILELKEEIKRLKQEFGKEEIKKI